MKRIVPAAGISLFVALVLAGCSGGCSKSSPASSPASPPPAAPAPTPTAPWLPTRAQSRLATTNLWIGPHVMTTEMALNEIQQRTGMMFRTNLPENEGMIFPLPFPQQASFWMMNCPSPLSAAYIDPEGVILEIHDFKPFNTNSVVADAHNILFVLETPQGWFKRHNVTTGTVIRSESGPLKDTFYPRR